jgi:hypothetical protein
MTNVAADRVRRGDRTVITTPQAGLRLGNWLYLWLRADERSASGCTTRILEAPGMEPWLAVFPGLAELTISRDDLRFHDRREWDHDFRYQRFGIDFTSEGVASFALRYLAPHIGPDASGTVVVNVRRGDYYQYEGFRDIFAFDLVGYLREALDEVGPAHRVLVVSDDAEWCRTNLDSLLRMTSESVDYAEPDPVENFRAVAGARRIIGTNSTFSYWAAYVAGVLHHDPQIIMPRFHARLPAGSDAYQLDPRWTAIPGHSESAT